MKNSFTLFCIGLLLSGSVEAQWCTPTATPQTMNSYAPSSPVITNVTFNTINRTSASSNKELYINTGMGTSVIQGGSITFSMTFTRDVPICPQHHIRIWIDWNQNGDFTDSGDLALTMDNTSSTSFSGTINVPPTATLGITRMRVAFKMIPSCGHTLPDPCVPPESFGWHGEIEDYDITVTPATGTGEIKPIRNVSLLVNNSEIQLNYFLESSADVLLSIHNIYGQRIKNLNQKKQSAGEQNLNIDRSLFSSAGMYIAILRVNNYTYTKKFFIER